MSEVKVVRRHYKYFTILGMLQITSLLATVLTIHKLWEIGPLLFPVSTFIFPITYFFGDVVAEVYGYKASRQLIWTSALCQYIFAITVYFLIKLPSPESLNFDSHFSFVLGGALWLTFSNTVGTITGAFLNAYVITKTKVFMKGKKFWLRSILSTSIGETAVTAIVGVLAFYNTANPKQIMTIILTAHSFKLIYGVVAVLPATKLVSYLKKKEGIDVYDIDTNFSPFSLDMDDNPTEQSLKDDNWKKLISSLKNKAGVNSAS